VKETIIYAACDPSTMEARYVGKTVYTLSYRLNKHLKTTEQNHRANWFRKLASEGTPPVLLELEVVAEGWEEAERFWIAYFKFLGARLLNATRGGEGTPGLRWSEESKEKQRKNAGKNIEINRKNIQKAIASNVGRKHSAEWVTNRKASQNIQKAIASNVGRKHSADWIANNVATRLGLKRTVETLTKLSTASKHRSSLSEQAVVELLELYYFCNYPIGALATLYDVHYVVVQRIIENKSYLWLPHPLRCPLTREIYIMEVPRPVYRRTHKVADETKRKITVANRKFDASVCQIIREEYENGKSMKDLADQFETNRNTVSHIIRKVKGYAEEVTNETSGAVLPGIHSTTGEVGVGA